MSYKIQRLLGTGGFGSVYSAINSQQNTLYAVKILSKANIQARKQQTKLNSEIQIHRSLSDKHICHFYSSFSDNDNYYFVLELCNNKTLSDFIKIRQQLHIFEIQYIAKEILEGLLYLKQRNVIHRDLKSANVFMNKNQYDNFEFKLGDFGLSCIYDKTNQQPHWTLCGTPNYISPTILIGHVIRRLSQQKSIDTNLSQETVTKCQQLAQINPIYNSPQTHAVDIWSFGILLYQLATKRCPFEGKSVTETYQNIIDVKIDYSPIAQYSQLTDLIKKCIEIDPEKRITVEQALEHTFLRVIQLKTFPSALYSTTFDQFFKSSVNRKKYLLEEKALNWDDFVKYNPDVFTEDLNSIAQLLLKEQAQTFTYQKVKLQIDKPILDSCLVHQLIKIKYEIQLKFELKTKQLIDYLKIYNKKPELNDQIPAYTLLCQLLTVCPEKKAYLPNIVPQRYLYSWIDQSNKYGFSCMTNDGWYSIKFNDDQIVVISSNQQIGIVIQKDQIQLLAYNNLNHVISANKVMIIRKVLKKMPDLIPVKDMIDQDIIKFLPILYEQNCYRIIQNKDLGIEQKTFDRVRNDILTNLRQEKQIPINSFNYIITFQNKKQIIQENYDLIIEYFKKQIQRDCDIKIQGNEQLYQLMSQTIKDGIDKILYNYNLIQIYDTKEIDRYKFTFKNNVQYNYTDHCKYSISKNEVVLVNECRNFCIMNKQDWDRVKNDIKQIKDRLSYEDTR